MPPNSSLRSARQRGRDVLNSLVDVVELEEMSLQALEASSARRRAIEAIEQAEQLRLQNIALNRRLVDAERASRERSARDNAALTERVAELEQRLAAALRTTTAAESIATPSPFVAPPAPKLLALPPPPPPPVLCVPSARHTRASLLLPTPDEESAERQMLARDRRVALYYRRGDQKDLRLCVRLASDEFVHSKITQHDDGSVSCLRQVCAATVEELLNVELGL
jgi:hypothetical protein